MPVTVQPLTHLLRDPQRTDAQHTESTAVSAPAKCAFEEVYRDEFRFIWRNARALGASRTDADDVVQDVFVVVHKRLHEFDGRRPIRSWLLAILIRVLYEHRRQVKRHSHPPPDPGLPSNSPSDLPDENLVRNQASRHVTAILDTMNDDQRVVFVLAELDEMSAPEIARILEVGENTVYSRLRLARQAFQAGLSRLRAKDTWRQS